MIASTETDSTGPGTAGAKCGGGSSAAGTGWAEVEETKFPADAEPADACELLAAAAPG